MVRESISQMNNVTTRWCCIVVAMEESFRGRKNGSLASVFLAEEIPSSNVSTSPIPFCRTDELFRSYLGI